MTLIFDKRSEQLKLVEIEYVDKMVDPIKLYRHIISLTIVQEFKIYKTVLNLLYKIGFKNAQCLCGTRIIVLYTELC